MYNLQSSFLTLLVTPAATLRQGFVSLNYLRINILLFSSFLSYERETPACG